MLKHVCLVNNVDVPADCYLILGCLCCPTYDRFVAGGFRQHAENCVVLCCVVLLRRILTISTRK